MMEEKVILASIFRQFHVKAMDKPEDLTLLSELILRPRDGIRLRLSTRDEAIATTINRTFPEDICG